jgi:hypothetical protein
LPRGSNRTLARLVAPPAIAHARGKAVARVLATLGLVALVACTAHDAADPASTPATSPTRTGEAAATASPTRTELAMLAPQQTRAGTLRFTTDAIRAPGAADAFLERLHRRSDGAETRAALVEALPRTGGTYAHALAALLDDPAPGVRAMVVHVARRADAAVAIAILERGLADTDAAVRGEALRSAAAHGALASRVAGLLGDRDVAVRAEAARTLGVLRAAPARDRLERSLHDADPAVRLEALRALDRIAPGSLAGHAALDTLARDTDDRVARLARKLRR